MKKIKTRARDVYGVAKGDILVDGDALYHYDNTDKSNKWKSPTHLRPNYKDWTVVGISKGSKRDYIKLKFKNGETSDIYEGNLLTWILGPNSKRPGYPGETYILDPKVDKTLFKEHQMKRKVHEGDLKSMFARYAPKVKVAKRKMLLTEELNGHDALIDLKKIDDLLKDAEMSFLQNADGSDRREEVIRNAFSVIDTKMTYLMKMAYKYK